MKIINASKRTDLPAFYPEFVRSTMENSPEDFFILWTKDIRPLFNTGILANHNNWYIQHTITGYNQDIEPNVYDKIEILSKLYDISQTFDKSRVVLRYDPIFFTEKYSMDYHIERFKRLMEFDITNQIIFSFLDWYRNIPKSLPIPSIKEQRLFAEKLASIDNGKVQFSTCAEYINLNDLGITKAQCVDPIRIEGISNVKITNHNSALQRKECGCIKAEDIGSYKHKCIHKCIYCYANHN